MLLFIRLNALNAVPELSRVEAYVPSRVVSESAVGSVSGVDSAEGGRSGAQGGRMEAEC